MWTLGAGHTSFPLFAASGNEFERQSDDSACQIKNGHPKVSNCPCDSTEDFVVCFRLEERAFYGERQFGDSMHLGDIRVAGLNIASHTVCRKSHSLQFGV